MERTNELDMSLLGVSMMDAFVAHNSASRVAMRSTHIGQAPTPVNGEQRRIFTGGEFRYAEYTFNVHFPVDAHVLKVVRKYLPTHVGGAQNNPRLFALYEPVQGTEKVIDVLEVPTYISHHKDFGYRLIFDDEVMERLRPGGMIRADEVIAGSPAIMNVTGYAYGINANVVSISDPSNTEDGIVVREGFLKKFTFHGYHSVSANCGRKYIPINLYGDEGRYQPFPNIGERTREDGLIFALREIDDTTSAVEMTPEALRKVNYLTDKLVYGEKNAKVVDITVYHDDRLSDGGCPDQIAEQMRAYYEAGVRFHSDIYSTYEQLRKRHGKSLKIGNDFERMVVDALIYLPAEGKDHVQRKFRLEDLDEWRVDIEYEYDITPHYGGKLTDLFGEYSPLIQVTVY